jgi:hypothetical protein
MITVIASTDWSTISSLATGAGTLVLAVATFASVRSANRSARIAEVALREQRRPVLAPSRIEDPVQKIMFVEGHWVRASGSRGIAEHADGNVYLAISLRNVGAGIGVCQAWTASAGQRSSRMSPRHTPEDQFRTQSRDLYVPAGDIGMWQGAIRDHHDPAYAALVQAIETRETITIELLYTDQVGDQRTISRFGLTPSAGDGTDDTWFASLNRHWYLDRPGPRPESDAEAAAEATLRVMAARAEEDGAEAEANSPQANGGEPAEREQTPTYSSSDSSPGSSSSASSGSASSSSASSSPGSSSSPSSSSGSSA